tara:strand:- start:1041 stop:1313 length:273 start_codon:yes stop_codon:yes gene_type:complete
MKVFLVKSIIVVVFVFILFQVTVGSQINKLKNSIAIMSNKEQREIYKDKLKDEMRKGIEKDNYFSEDERILISRFLKKILTELELIDINK